MATRARTASCKRCGRTNLGWAQNKAGRWYLCATMGDGRPTPWIAHVCGSQGSLTTDTPQVRALLEARAALPVDVAHALNDAIHDAIRDANPGAHYGDISMAVIDITS